MRVVKLSGVGELARVLQRQMTIKNLCRVLGFVMLLCLFSSPLTEVCAAQEMDLMQGDLLKGRISFIERDAKRYIALDQVLSSLGFAPASVSGGLVATFSGRKIEFWSGSNISRVNGMVYALPSVVFMENKRWWGDANVSIKIFSHFLESLSRPSDLRLVKASADAPASDPQMSLPVAPKIPTVVERPLKPQGVPKAESIPLTGVRWGEQAQAYRAVIDIERHTDVSVKEYADRVELLFAGASSSKLSSVSPWPPLSVTSGNTSGGALLTFKHSAKSIKSFWVTDPSRYVVDFYKKESAVRVDTEKKEVISPSTRTPTIQTRPSVPQDQPAQHEALPGGKKFLVVVDAGHGGHDPGASGNGVQEKVITLKAALELASKLKNLGINVRLTRDTDVYLKLGERTSIANSVKADVFISLHCNALPIGKRASGMELYLMAEPSDKDALNLAVHENKELAGENTNSGEVMAAADRRTKLLLKILGDMQQNDKITESTSLAEDLYKRSKDSGFSIRKVRQAPFFVLRGAGMPAVLVEMGYVTDANEARLLSSADYRQKMMDALAAGVLDYLKKNKGDG